MKPKDPHVQAWLEPELEARLVASLLGEASAFEQAELEQAAQSNEVLQGQLNYDPNKVDDFLLGNTAEENSALKRMAGRLVSHQQAADLGVRGLEVSLPARGELLTFHRSVQVDISKPLRLELTLAPEGKVPLWFLGAIIILLGLLAFTGSRGQVKA